MLNHHLTTGELLLREGDSLLNIEPPVKLETSAKAREKTWSSLSDHTPLFSRTEVLLSDFRHGQDERGNKNSTFEGLPVSSDVLDPLY